MKEVWFYTVIFNDMEFYTYNSLEKAVETANWLRETQFSPRPIDVIGDYDGPDAWLAYTC